MLNVTNEDFRTTGSASPPRARSSAMIATTPLSSSSSHACALGRCRLFRNLPTDRLELLGEPETFTLKRGASLSWEADEDRHIYLIEHGMVKLTAAPSDSNKETILAILGEGELFGRIPLANEQGGSSHAVAMEETTILRIDAAGMERLLDSMPDLANRIIRMIGRRLRRLETRVSHLLFKDARQRVAFILLELMHEWGSAHSTGGNLLDLRITHQDIANLTGLTRETVSVTLADFDLNELIATQGRRLIVMNPKDLRDVMTGT